MKRLSESYYCGLQSRGRNQWNFLIFLYSWQFRTKTDDPEREKLKAKAKDMQRDEAERIRYVFQNLEQKILILRFKFQAWRGKQNSIRSYRRPKETKIWWHWFLDGSSSHPSEIQNQESPSEGRDVYDGTREELKTFWFVV